MNNLRDLIEKYGSDKNRNEYTPIYHSILNPSRGKKVTGDRHRYTDTGSSF